MHERVELIADLEDRFRHISMLLYDTSIDPRLVDAEVAPMLDPQVRFTDPWQVGVGQAKYRLGLAGFHAMFQFVLEMSQVSVQLADDGRSGRAIVDGVMQLRPLGRLFMYPLRTILVYDFVLVDSGDGKPKVSIQAHEEMWSIADMVTALPMTGWFYRQVFRPAFGRGFLAASWLSARARGMLPEVR